MTPPAAPGAHGLLDDKVVVVTAAAGTGIGFATAKRALEEGAFVVVSDHHERRLGEAAETLTEVAGTAPHAVVCDVTVEDDVQRLLDDTDHKIARVAFGHFGASGSLLAGRAAISQREFGEATPRAESGELGKSLFSRRRSLVIDADHPTIRNLLGLAVREPELAAYQLVKLFLLASGSIAATDDSKLANVAMIYRETRCPRPMS